MEFEENYKPFSLTLSNLNNILVVISVSKIPTRFYLRSNCGSINYYNAGRAHECRIQLLLAQYPNTKDRIRKNNKS